MFAPYESRIVEKFKVIRALAYQCEGQAAEMWECAAMMQKLAKEIQTLLGAGQGYPQMQDPGHGWAIPSDLVVPEAKKTKSRSATSGHIIQLDMNSPLIPELCN